MRSIITLAALVAAALPLAPASAQSMRGYVSGPTRLYSGPLRDYPSVRILRRGTMVSVQGCLRDWTWCDVVYGRDRGWVAGNALRITYQGRRRGLAGNMGIGVTTFSFGTYWDNHYQGRRFYGQRQRWQSQSDNAYRPEWGEREQRQNRDIDPNRGRNRDRRQNQGQHGNNRHSDSRQVEDQQRLAEQRDERRDSSAIPRYTGEPYRFPDHGAGAVQPKRQPLTFGPAATPGTGESARSAQGPDLGTLAAHPRY